MEAFKDEKTFGPYQLHAKIAEGGMAEVILGTSQQKEYHGQFLAIKRLRPHLNSNKPFVNLLIHEAKIGVLLNHPGIATVYDLGSYKSEFFLTMEYVHGKSLDRILERVTQSKSPRLSVEVATYITLEILRALAFAHELKDSKGRDLNIIHRDISPGNILLSYRGEVKLADFGIATAESRLQPNFSNTPLGKLAYMSPEQVVNDPVVRASDLYSLGVVYYQMLSGQLPFHAENPNALYKKVIDGRVTDLRLTGPTISPGLRDIVNKCLNRSSAKRYQTAPELYQTLVEHFNSEYELDFNSKAIRQYYKKKLSEYMRAAFESEIIQEIEITQDCLKRGEKKEDFKVTAPQDLKRLSDFSQEVSAPEATVYQEDLTNENTRNFPLTEEERNRIIKGLPVKEVIAAGRKQAEAKAGRTSGFDMQTIPEYDLVAQDSTLKRISVEDKLKLSSLDRDQKETLKQQVPLIEISSEVELEKFEENTFSDKRPAAEADPQSTRAMSKDEIIRDFKKIQASGLDEETVYDPGVEKNKAKPPERTSGRTSLGNIKKFKTVERTSIVEVKENRSAQKRWILTTALICCLLGGVYWVAEFSPFRSISQERLALTTPQTLDLVFFGEGPLELQSKFVANLKESNDSISGIESIFENEFKRYRNETQKIVSLNLIESIVVPSRLSAEAQAPELIRSDRIFDYFERMGVRPPQSQNPAIYIYLYTFDPSSTQSAALPDQFMGPRSKKRGVVFAPAHSSKRLFVLESLAREIAFLYGAQDREDPMTRLPAVPHGLANPKEVPLFPQSKAELTGRNIAISSIQVRPITSLSEIVIGPQTAYELGWIDRAKRDELLK